MAAKDSQGLQAIVITLFIVVILFGVGLILVNNARKTQWARAEELQNQANQARNAERELQQQANNFKQWMGFAEGDSYQAIEPIVKEDLETYGKNFEEENRAYRKILAANADELRNSANNEARAKDQVQKQAQQIQALQAEADARVEAATSELAKAKADMASQTNQFQQQRQAFMKQTAEIKQQLADVRQSFEQQLAKAKADNDALQTRVDDLTRSTTLLKNNQVQADPFAQPADGKIAYVNQRFGKAWINLGTADGLRPQVTFSVFAPNELDATNAVKKASVEVVRVVEPHLAEVRIVDDEPTNPIVPGDKIYSQVWDRGRSLGFAIAGTIDLDGDGEDDLDLLERIIRVNNGRIDAAPGKETDMSVRTRYLVLGEFPAATNSNAAQLQQHWNETAEKADDLGIETIDLNEFLKLMGWKSENKAVALGADARPRDFPASARTSRDDLPPKLGTPRGTFRNRLPPTPY